VKTHWQIIIIFVLSTIILIILISCIVKKNNEKKPKIHWFKRHFDEMMLNNTFLIWFPLNGIMHGSLAGLSARDSLKIMHSRHIAPLVENKIIEFGFGSITINTEVYDIIDKWLKSCYVESDADGKKLIEEIKSRDFQEVIFKSATTSEYDLKI
jgi:hypothetical protein